MIGDLSPFYAHSAVAPAPPSPLGPHGAALFSPTLRNFKASENQSPRPQDRVYFDFNFYSNVNSTVNTAQRSPVNQLNAYTYMWGFEKTFDQGNGSIGMRLPLNSLTATSSNGAVPAPTSTALGNLDIFGKYILKQNLETGSLITAGFQITPSTGTSRFAGAPYIASLNTTYFQPFIAYLWRRDRFFIQGFTGFDFPANNADVSLIYNDIGMGYMVYQNADTTRFITAIAPTFEVHVNSPINHRNPYNMLRPGGLGLIVQPDVRPERHVRRPVDAHGRPGDAGEQPQAVRCRVRPVLQLLLRPDGPAADPDHAPGHSVRTIRPVVGVVAARAGRRQGDGNLPLDERRGR